MGDIPHRAQVRVLGTIDVVIGDRTHALSSAREREVLAALASHAGRVVPADELIDVMWRDAPPASARQTLSGLVWRLRKLLGAAAIEARAGGYSLSGSEVELDSERFERLVAQAHTLAGETDTETAATVFDTALALWRGRPFGELADRPYVRVEAARLEELRAAAVEDRADICLVSCPPSGLVPDLEAAVAEEPYRERRQGQLMLALARSGRPVEALRAYQRFRRQLADEVGVVPSRSLQRLNEDILRQAPGAEWEYSDPEACSVAAEPERLPRSVTSFVGRANDLAALREAVRRRGLVTVCGPAGVGKTRLVTEAAHIVEAGEQPSDGVWWCDLSAIASHHDEDRGDEVANAIASALGASPERGVATRERIMRFLADKDLLLVIDNCEHVIGPVAELVAGILQRAPGVGVLATSRESLAINGEHVVDLEPLTGDDALRLFLDRAAAVRSGFELTPENAQTVADICGHLDGIPLALELAAGRLKSLGVTDLARLLDDRLRVLVSSRRDAPDRHRTLRTAIDISHDALSIDEQAVFSRLAVFPESFDLDAAEAVCEDGLVGRADVLELLSHLVARSLLVAQSDTHGAVRYRFLESLRIYATECLARAGEGSIESAHRRHAEHYAGVVAQAAAGITGPAETRWVTWLVTEVPNLRAAVHWACAHDDPDLAVRLFTPLHPWTWCGKERTSEIGRWATLLARRPGIEDHPAYPRLCEWGLRGATSSGDQAHIHEWTTRATAPGFSQTPVIAGCLAFAAMADDPTAGTAMFLRATEEARAIGDHLTEAAHLTMISNSQRAFSAQSPEVVGRSLRCLAAARASGSPTSIAWGLFNVAMTLPGTDRRLALEAIEELPSVVAGCAFADTNLEHGAEYASAFIKLADGDLSGLGPLRAEISAKAASAFGGSVTLHVLRLALALVHVGKCPDVAAELIAGVRSQRLVFTQIAEQSADLLRLRMGDGPYEVAERRGEHLTIAQLAERALAIIDHLLPPR